jgi:uncharacterized membrane protein YoaT (DUF817 family)
MPNLFAIADFGVPMDDAILALTPAASVVVVFLLARMIVHFTVVYRRNNLAAGLAFVLFGLAVYLLGWWGFIAFSAGTLIGAWQWAASIDRANEHVARPSRSALVRPRSRTSTLSHWI